MCILARINIHRHPISVSAASDSAFARPLFLQIFLITIADNTTFSLFVSCYSVADSSALFPTTGFVSLTRGSRYKITIIWFTWELDPHNLIRISLFKLGHRRNWYIFYTIHPFLCETYYNEGLLSNIIFIFYIKKTCTISIELMFSTERYISNILQLLITKYCIPIVVNCHFSDYLHQPWPV